MNLSLHVPISDGTFQNHVGTPVPRSVVDVPVPQAVMVTFRELTSGVECRLRSEKPQQSPTVESLGSVDALVVVTLVNKIPILALLPSLPWKWKMSDLQPGVTPHNLEGSAALSPSSSPILEQILVQAGLVGEKKRHAHQDTPWPAVRLARHVTARVVVGSACGPRFVSSWLSAV